MQKQNVISLCLLLLHSLDRTMVTEDEMVGWHHQLNGHESEQALGDSEGQGKPGVLQFVGSQRVRRD